MLKVGDFSQLAHVTVKTLRHYDRLGLLKPVWLDRYTGYRYYSLDQLPRLYRILALKDLGFSLAQIGMLLDQDLPVSQLRSMFDQKQAELEQHLQAEQMRLQRVAMRLEQIEQHGGLPSLEVTLKSVPELPVASLRLVVPQDASRERHLERMRAELLRLTSASGVHLHGQWMLLYHNPDYRQTLDLELAVVINETPPPKVSQLNPALNLHRLPAVPEMACTLKRLHLPGALPGLTEDLYADLFTWAEQNGFAFSGPLRQVMLVDPQADGEQAGFIEVQMPVESILRRKTKILKRLHKKEQEMEPKIVKMDAFTVVGTRYYGKNEHQEISGLWGEFNRRSHEIQHIVPGSPAFGVCLTVPDAPNGEFEYIASFRVDPAADVPPGMVVRHLPAHKYAVFTHTGSLDKLGSTYHYIYDVWMPQSGFQPMGLDFELYDEDFKDFAEDSKFYIYVPIG